METGSKLTSEAFSREASAFSISGAAKGAVRWAGKIWVRQGQPRLAA